MANELDELDAPLMEQGNDVKVIAKQLPVKLSTGTKIFDGILWILPVPIISGIIWSIVKEKKKAELLQLQQKIQHAASTVDNYLEQRVQILQNCAAILEKAIALDKDTFSQIAKYRSGIKDDEVRNECQSAVTEATKAINVAIESYPDLKSHAEIADAMQQNSRLQKEITAAREVYNDVVARWNSIIYQWPTYQIVAAKQGYTTRIPFIADAATKEAARKVFF